MFDRVIHRSGNATCADHALAPETVAILLSTFNGERYLAEQLASFTAQTHADWRLYWRDDGSSDTTPALLAAFTIAHDRDRCIRHLGHTNRMGAAGSFLALLHQALQGSAEFFAFSDQDDVWLPHKLSHGVAALAGLPLNQSALYYCARELVDAGLHPIGQTLLPQGSAGFPACLTQNLAPGCCTILNRAAAELIDASTMPDGTWHDWWSYIVVSAHGGPIIAGDFADILYRQHGGNAIGERIGFWRRGAAALRRGPGPFMTLFDSQIAALRADAAHLPDATNRVVAIINDASHSGLSARMKALRIPGLNRQTRLETALFRLWFLLG